MSEKKLKQMRLPFALLTSPGTESTPKSVEKSSPKTPVTSRKRKPSSEGDNARSTKIGRRGSKENIAAKAEVVEIRDSEEELEAEEIADEEVKAANETTPTVEPVLHIKLQSCSKSKRKINMDVKPPKCVEELNEDDSIVYLDEEVLPKKSKKSVKKSEKKKKKETTVSDADKAKKVLKMGGSVEEEAEKPTEKEAMEVDNEPEVVDLEDSENETEKIEEVAKGEEKSAEDQEKKSAEDQEDKSEDQDVPQDDSNGEQPTKSPEPKESTPDNISSTFDTIPSKVSSQTTEEPEAIHDELVEVLSDNSDNSENTTSPTGDANKTPSSNKIDITKLTPKQLARRQEQEARRLEKELQRQRERDLKEQQRLKEKKEREDAKRREKEEKEEARKKEKEERDKKRQAELDKKEEEKRQKEEERKRIADQRDEEKRAKEEERKRIAEQRDEEKRKKEEAQKKKEQEEENRKKRAAEAFSKFFVPPKKKVDVATAADDENSKDSVASSESTGAVRSNFMPFQVRERMKLAPIVRHQISKEQLASLEEDLKGEKPVEELYLKQLKGDYKPKSSGKTWPVDEKDEDVVVVPDELEGVGEDIEVDEAQIKMKHRAKFLMFVENRRPAYYGTWRKKTTNISARRPFAQDKKFFDYEVDSDEEWEEEEPGESLHGSDSEKEKDGAEEEDYEVDNDFFVPHGHLSDGEIQQMDDEEEENNHPETQKAKLKILQQEFAAEMKKKTEKIKPRLIGCIWMNGDEDENGCTLDKKYHCSDIIWRILKAREAWTSEEGVKIEETFEPELPEPEEEVEKPAGQPKTPANTKTQPKAKFDEKSTRELLRLVHGNVNSKKFIVREFQAYWLKTYHKEPDFLEFSQKNVDERMMEVADYKTCPDEGALFGKKCWYGKADVMTEIFGDEKPKLPNEWSYVLKREVKEKVPKQKTGEEDKKESSPPVAAKEVAVKEVPKPIPAVFRASPASVKTGRANSTADKSQPTPIAVKAQPTPIAVKAQPGTTKQTKTPSPSVAQPKKRVQLLMSVPRGQPIPETKKNSLICQFIKSAAEVPKKDAVAPTSSKMDTDDDVVIID